MKAKVHVALKPPVLDPQGQAIRHALAGLGFGHVADVRQGKLIELTLQDGLSREQAEHQVRAMCERLLANPVIEDYTITFEG